HRVIDVNASGLDVYLFSTYKTFGTHVGVMWGRHSVLASLDCQGHFFNDDKPRYRLNPAGPLHAEIASLAGIGAYIDTIYAHHFDDGQESPHRRAARVFDLFADHEAQLANQVLDALKAMAGVRIIGQDVAAPGRRAATISVVLDGIEHSEAVRQLAGRQIAVRNGHFYAFRCVKALGIEDPEEGVIRISIVHYNHQEDAARLVEGLKAL
ncbi:MAG: cysteine desulfurase, partial [Deltaproteobacteria bacterium SG8_13]